MVPIDCAESTRTAAFESKRGKEAGAAVAGSLIHDAERNPTLISTIRLGLVTSTSTARDVSFSTSLRFPIVHQRYQPIKL
jgi:hypothetical protein